MGATGTAVPCLEAGACTHTAASSGVAVTLANVDLVPTATAFAAGNNNNGQLGKVHASFDALPATDLLCSRGQASATWCIAAPSSRSPRRRALCRWQSARGTPWCLLAMEPYAAKAVVVDRSVLIGQRCCRSGPLDVASSINLALATRRIVFPRSSCPRPQGSFRWPLARSTR